MFVVSCQLSVVSENMTQLQETSNLQRRKGLTLVELLVVIVILSLVTAATIPLMQPATTERRIREGARMVATVMANAQARALATGRPVGVWFQRLPYAESEFDPQDLVNPQNGLADQPAHFAIEMFLCEVPSPFTGETSQASAQIGQTSPPSQNERQVALWEGPPGGTPTRFLRKRSVMAIESGSIIAATITRSTGRLITKDT